MTERVFVRDLPPRFKRGMLKDYPVSTWKQIAASAKLPLEKIALPPVEAQAFAHAEGAATGGGKQKQKEAA